eukprot:672703_1
MNTLQNMGRLTDQKGACAMYAYTLRGEVDVEGIAPRAANIIFVASVYVLGTTMRTTAVCDDDPHYYHPLHPISCSGFLSKYLELCRCDFALRSGSYCLKTGHQFVGCTLVFTIIRILFHAVVSIRLFGVVSMRFLH